MSVRFVYILMVMLLSSCSFFERTDDILLARLGDSELHKSEITIPSSLSGADSIAFVQQYIVNWAKEELILNKAQFNINADALDIEKRLEAYKRSLLIHAYEQKLIEQQLDTLVTDSQIQRYYESHYQDYLLADTIARVMYLHLSSMAPKLDSIKDLLFDRDSINFEAIEEYAHQYSKRYYYNEFEWLPWADLQKLVPVKHENSLFDKDNYTMLVEDSLDVYLLRLLDVKEQGEIAPRMYVEEEIKSILLNQRKLKTIDVIQNKLFEDAKKSNQFETY